MRRLYDVIAATASRRTNPRRSASANGDLEAAPSALALVSNRLAHALDDAHLQVVVAGGLVERIDAWIGRLDNQFDPSALLRIGNRQIHDERIEQRLVQRQQLLEQQLQVVRDRRRQEVLRAELLDVGVERVE